MIEQGTTEWFNEKLGVLSSTRAYNLMSSKATRTTLLATLIRELMTSDRKNLKQTPSMQRGLDIEAEAASYYGILHGVTVTDQSAYIESDIHPMFAASPDGLIAPDGGYEGKRLDEENHIKVLLNPASHPDHKKYIKQCEWNLFVTGRKWWDLHYYCETLPESMKSLTIRIERDEAMMDKMRTEAEAMLEDLSKFLNEHGVGGLLT